MDFYQEIKQYYPHLSQADVKRIVNKAQMYYFMIKYPTNPQKQTEEITDFASQQWVLAVCDELVERLGFNSAIGYRENGVSWTWDGVGISQRLVNLITPEIGI